VPKHLVSEHLILALLVPSTKRAARIFLAARTIEKAGFSKTFKGPSKHLIARFCLLVAPKDVFLKALSSA
jgi:hypothetical protein